MSADAAENQNQSTPYVALAAAVFFGVVVGYVMSGGDKAVREVRADLESRVEAAESAAAAAAERAAAAIADAEAAAAAGAEKAAESAAATVAELQGKLDEVAAEAAASGDAEQLDAVSNRVQVLAEQMAEMIAAMRAGGAVPAPAAPAKTAPAAEEADSGADAEALAAEIGESGLILAVGQTGAVDNARVFMSRIDAEAGEARIMVVGSGPTMIGAASGPVELANGCSLTLAGVADRRAYIKVACGS